MSLYLRKFSKPIHRSVIRLSSTNAIEKMYKGNKTLGLVREDYGMWERRAPLSPDHVKVLVNQGFTVIIQPCSRRIFSNTEYIEAGAIINENLQDANLIIGVKKINSSLVYPDKSYMFFSHVIKAQPANMPMLDQILQLKARLFDYECITKYGRDDTKRLVAFGKYAGMAGMIDSLQGLGQRLLADGYSTPFLNISNAFMHENLKSAKNSFRGISKQINTSGISKNLSPIVFAFTGTGNVSGGAQEMFENLPHQYINLEDLKYLEQDVQNGRKNSNKIYGIVLKPMDMVKHRSTIKKDYQDNKNLKNKKNMQYNTEQHYFSHPEEYESSFATDIAPYITMLINGIYWDHRYPRLLTKNEIVNLRKNGNHKLKVIADISCDIGGSVEFLSHCTSVENPFFTYIPEQDKDYSGISADGILMLGVDILPSELPRDSSEHFSQALMDLLPPLLTSEGSSSPDDSDLPPELRRACIASHGALCPKWSYISILREQQQATATVSTALEGTGSMPKKVIDIEMRGHLFDSGLINRLLNRLDELSHSDSPTIGYSISLADVRPNATSGPVPSRVVLRLTGSEGDVDRALAAVRLMVDEDPSAEGSLLLLQRGDDDEGPLPGDEVPSKDVSSIVSIRSQKRVLIFGAGRVAKPVLKLLNQHPDIFVTVASDQREQGEELVRTMKGDESRFGPKARFQQYTFPQDNETLLPTLMRDCDVCISLLPANMHIPLAEEAIRQRRHLVTASYVSPEMRALHQRAVEEGVVLLNEVGLDPGLDHMLLMQAIDSIHERGGKVTELVSLCGGLPDPVAANNPLMYKISWSPRGVLNAMNNTSRYLQQGKQVFVDGKSLLCSAQPSNRFPSLRLEVIPNRDALLYRDLYGVPDVDTICRGTLRYEGWSNIFQAFKVLDLLNPNQAPHEVWKKLLQQGDLAVGIQRLLTDEGSVKDVPAAMNALRWLGMLNESNNTLFPVFPLLNHSNQPMSAVEALCQLLEDKLKYKENERDMVAMFHSVAGRMPDGSLERHTSRLLDFGDVGESSVADSSMSKTVGYTTGAAAELLLYGRCGHNESIPVVSIPPGVVIPTRKEIYQPMLSRMKDFGITWLENIEIEK